MSQAEKQTTIRNARVEDAASLWRLVRNSGVLDLNSPYAYLLLCRDHSGTCMVAEEGGDVVAFVTAYVPPATPDVIFIWQIGVTGSHRRRGLARGMLHQLLARCPDARFLECTVTPSNQASLGLFRAIAADFGTAMTVLPGFAVDDFPPEATGHDREDLIRIGPLSAASSNAACRERSLRA